MRISVIEQIKDAVRDTKAYAAARTLKQAAGRSTAYAAARHGIAIVEEMMGAESKFCIRGAYKHRTEILDFDATGSTDEYQRDVYLRAADIARSENVKTIYDVGCGSGYKLVHYLGEYETTGFEVPKALEFLRRAHPDRTWAFVLFSDRSYPPADLVICADVIEHVPDPNELMQFLISITRKHLIISTPDRNLLYSPLSLFQLGPPNSWHHAREWAFDEFNRYVSQFADIKEHVHPDRSHSTQMIIATVRN